VAFCHVHKRELSYICPDYDIKRFIPATSSVRDARDWFRLGRVGWGRVAYVGKHREGEGRDEEKRGVEGEGLGYVG